MKRVISIALCFLMVFALCPSATFAASTITWNGAAGDGSWHTVDNWNLGKVPEDGDYVIIPESSVVEYVYDETSVRLNCAGNLTVSGGTLKITNPSLYENSSLINGKLDGEGDITITEGSNLLWSGGSIEGPGRIIIENKANLNANASSSLDRYLVNNGSLLITDSLRLTGGAEGSGNFNIQEGKTLELSGSGAYDLSSSNISNMGTLRISNTCTFVNFNSDYTQQSTGTLKFDVGGPSDFTKLEVAGTASLNGILKINILDGYNPSSGDTFEIMTCGSSAGTFSSIESNMPEVDFVPTYTDTGLTLTVQGVTTVPTAPQSFTATPGDTQVALSWTAPASDGGAAITHYEVSAGDGTWVTASTSTSHTFTGLTNGTEYTFKVRAVNSAGNGAEVSATATPVAPATPVPTQPGQLYAWGNNVHGQLGDGTLDTKSIPTHIGTAEDWTAVSAGYQHTVALKSDGSLWAWGKNEDGRLGDGTAEFRKDSPVQIGSDNDWAAVEAGEDRTVALKTDGSLWAWGYAMGGFEYGGNPINWYAPTLVDNNNKWIAVSAGITHVVAMKEDGTLWGWGFNAHGELGSSDFDGYTDFTESPVQISDDRWIAVSAGNYFTVGLKEDGSLWAWGWNKMGQLGDGTTVDKHVPTRVGSDGDSWLAAAAGLNHVVAIKADGSLWAWGGNEYGELGNGSYDGIVDPPPHPVPAQIGTDTDWIFVSTGDSHNAAFKTDGSLWLWGLNGTGQLGDGTSGTAKTVPQRLDGAGTWLAVACGGSHTVATLEAGLTVPTVPQNFTATPGDTQVELTWEAPASDGGAAITHYEVSADDGTTWVTASTSTSHTFTGLTNGTEYTFKVRAVNSEGHGDAASVTATPCATSAGDFAGGSGTEEDPYLISTVAHLDNVRNYLDKHFKLTANLDLSVYGGEEGWEPIGTGTDPFTGYFDGDGHTISNLFIDRITEPRIGLFGYTGDTADIRDISLEDVRVTGDFYVGGLVGWNEGVIASAWVTGDVTGRSETGGLVGVNHGLITESWVEGTVTDVWGGDIGGLVAENYDRISNCHADAVVSSVSSFAGGLAGSNYGIINTSYAAGSVEGSSYVGGLVGLNSEGSIDTCYATGDANGTEDWINYTFVGGLVGLNRGSISNSYARGDASGSEDIGGLVGSNADIGSITNSYSTGAVSGDSYIGGLVGYGHTDGIITDSYWDTNTSLQEHSAGGTGKNTAAMKQQETYENWNFADIWGINSSDNDGYPFLRWQGEEPSSEPPVLSGTGANDITQTTAALCFTLNKAGTYYYLVYEATQAAPDEATIKDQGAAVAKGTGAAVTAANNIAVTGLTASTEYKAYLIVEDAEGNISSIALISFTTTTAVPTYALIITAGTGGSITSGSSGNYEEGAVINIAAVPASGYSFDQWTSVGGGTFGSITSTSTTFTMPANAVTITAVFRLNSSGGGGGGGGSTPPAPVYEADVETESGTKTTLPVTVDPDAGNASVETYSQTFAQGGTVISMPSIPGVDTYSVGIPVPDLSTANLQSTLTLNTGAGSISVPSNMLSGVAEADGNKAQISIGQGDKSTLPEDIKTAIGDRPLIQLTLSIDGNQTDWNNPEAPVTVSIPYTPTAAELAHPESIVVWYIDGSGNTVPVSNGQYDPETGTVTFTTTHFSYYAVGYHQVNFKDVVSDAWYVKAVSFIAAREITTGTGSGNFSPEAKLTRGQFIVMLMKAYAIAPDLNPQDNFADAGNTYYTGYLAAAKRLGISAGVGNNLFAPEKEITRQEMFTLLYNALRVIGQLPEGDSGKTLSDFTDAGQVDTWAKDAMTLLVKTGTVGGSGGKLNPTGTTTRAEMAQVLYNLLGR